MNNTQKFTIFTAISAFLWMTGCHQSDSSAHHGDAHAIEPVTIEQVTASIEPIHLYTQTTGTVRSKNRASIAPKVSGQITEIHVVPGQHVEKGERLLDISALEITSKLQSAQANMDKVGRDLKREEDLLLSGASTQEIVNNLKDQWRIAQAAVKEASTMLSYTEIVAPFSGVITRKIANEGDLSLPGNPLIEMENFENLQVEAGIPEAIGIQLHVGMKIKIQIAGVEQTIDGTLSEIAPAADPVSRTFPVKISLPKDLILKSGQFAKVSIPTKSVPTVLVPTAAISHWGQIERVFIVKEDSIHMQIVKTGSLHDDKIEILSGLSGGETLAIRVDGPLKDGAPVHQ